MAGEEKETIAAVALERRWEAEAARREAPEEAEAVVASELE